MAYQYNYATGQYEEIPSRPLLGPMELDRPGYPTPETGQDTFYRGIGEYGEQAFTNIPERAGGLRRASYEELPGVTVAPYAGGRYAEGGAFDKEKAAGLLGWPSETAKAPYDKQVAEAQAFNARPSGGDMRSKILRWASANKIPAAEVAATMKNYGVGEAAVAPKYETLSPGQRMVDASGRVIYAAPAKVEGEREPTSEFGMFAKDYLQRKPGTSMAQIVKDYHAARIPGTGSDELESRGRVSRLVNSQLQAKYGKTGARYDNISQQWVFPPNFNQEAFYKDYQALEKGYLKKFGISEVLPEQEIEAPEVQGQHPLTGKEPAVYSIDGREVMWDGNKEL